MRRVARRTSRKRLAYLPAESRVNAAEKSYSCWLLAQKRLAKLGVLLRIVVAPFSPSSSTLRE